MNAPENPGNGHGNAIEIIINTRAKTVPHGQISYTDVVALAFPGDGGGPDNVFTVDYSLANGTSGGLILGEQIPVQKGMVFNVTRTHRS